MNISRSRILVVALILTVALLSLFGRGLVRPPETLRKTSADLERRLREAGDSEFIDAIITMGSRLPSDSLKGRSRSEVVAKLREYATASQSDLLKSLGEYAPHKISRIKPSWLGNCISITATRDVIRAVGSRSDVAAVRENRWYAAAQAFELVAVPALAPTWDHQNMMGLDSVWKEFGCYGNGIVVAVLDAGVDVHHPDLEGKMADDGWAEFDKNGNPVASVPTDSSGHGTAVTSVIVGGNASGFDIGVAPEAKFIHAKIMNKTAAGQWSPGGNAQVIEGMAWAAERADIVVLPFDYGDKAGIIDPDLEPALQDMVNAGVIPIASVGNTFFGFDSPCYVSPDAVGNSAPPGNSSSCIGVGAVKHLVAPGVEIQLDLGNSSCGAAIGGQRKPNLVAPGDSIFSAWPVDQPGEPWALVSGTSAAAPRVAGIAALMLQCSQGLREVDVLHRKRLVKKALDNPASTVCPSGPDGHGFPNNYPNWCTLPCPNPYYGAGALHDSMAIWNLEDRDENPLECKWQLVWRKLTGNVVDTQGRTIHGATTLLNTGQRVLTGQDGVYAVWVEAGRWIPGTPPACGYFVTRVDTVQVIRPPFPPATGTVGLDAYPDPETPVVMNFELNAPGILEISGYVRDFNGNPVSGVAVAGLPFGRPVTKMTGFYRDFVLPGWSGTLRPTTLAGDVFLPDSLEIIQPVTRDLLNQDFTINVRRITGVLTSTVEPFGPIEGLIVEALENGAVPTASDVTDAAGSYEIRLPTGWSGTVSPRYKGLYNDYSPPSRYETIGSANLSGRDFLGIHIATEWLPDGLPLDPLTSYGGQYPAVVSGGSGAALIVWDKLWEPGESDLALQKVLNNGDLRWTKGGLAAHSLPTGSFVAAPDGTGGVLLAFVRGQHVYAQRIGPNEEMLWGSGLEVGHADNAGLGIKVTADERGGFYVLWFEGDPPGGPADGLYVVRLRSDGTSAWPASVQVGPGHVDHGASSTSLTPDGTGGAIVSWEEQDHVYAPVILYAQRIDSLGVIQWTPGGVLVEETNATYLNPKHAAVTDGQHGVVFAWLQEGVYYVLQRINSQGSKMWGGNTLIGWAPNCNGRFALASDGEGGAIVAFVDDTYYHCCGRWETLVQRIDSQGTKLWGGGFGVSLCQCVGTGIPGIVSDEVGGAIVSWSCGESLRTQRVDSNGNILWHSSVLVTSTLATGTEHQMVPDGAHGAIVAWGDDRSFTSAVYAQRIGEAAVPVTIRGYLKSGDQLIAFPDTFVVGCPAGDADTLVVEVDFDNTMMRDIAAEELTLSAPGGTNVLLHWQSPPIADSPATAPEFRTTITQAYISGCGDPAVDSVPVLLNGALIGSAPIKVKSPDLAPSGKVNIADLGLFSTTFPPNPNCPGQPGYIDCANYKTGGAMNRCVDIGDLGFLACHWLHQAPGYGGQGLSSGIVARRGVDAIFEPHESVGEKSTGEATFDFQLANADSIALLGIMIRTTDELEFVGFTPSAGFEERLMVTPNKGQTSVLSVIVAGGQPIKGNVEVGTLEFKCKADPSADQLIIVDAEALRSDGSICGVGRTGAAAVNGAAITYRNFLGRNRPNPFNPTTRIEYSIEKDSHVDLAVYNARGQLVRTLVNEDLPRGDYVISWDATNNVGELVASGVYFYKLETPYFRDTKKLTILR